MPRHSIPATIPTFAEYRSQPDFGTSIDHDRDEWIIAPCQQNRDSDTLTRSNFSVMVAELERIEQDAQPAEDGAEYFDVFELHRFGHWAYGWLEIVLVRPGSAAAEYVADLAEALADYPVADEEHFSQLESDEAAESWESWGARDFKRALLKEFGNGRAAEFVADVATDEQLREWMEELYPNEPYHFDSGGCSFPIDRAVSACGRGELAAFAWKLRGDLRGE